MTRSIFSWIYSPGCFGLPDLQDKRCALCGNIRMDCACTECDHPVLVDGTEQRCGVQGCLEHLLDRELVARIEVLDNQLANLRGEAERRQIPTLPCPVCGEVQTVDIFNSGPYLCHGYFYAGEKHGWIKKEIY